MESVSALYHAFIFDGRTSKSNTSQQESRAYQRHRNARDGPALRSRLGYVFNGLVFFIYPILRVRFRIEKEACREVIAYRVLGDGDHLLDLLVRATMRPSVCGRGVRDNDPRKVAKESEDNVLRTPECFRGAIHG